MRAAICILALGLLAACDYPDDRGAGFGGPNSAREQELTGNQSMQLPQVSTVPLPGGSDSPSDIAAQTAAALAASSGAGAGGAGINPIETGEPPSAVPGSSIMAPEASQTLPAPSVNQFGISRENDFEAVSESRTIESDAERIARTRAQYQVVEPTPLQPRPSEAQPDIVRFALNTRHQRGTKMYPRSPIRLGARTESRCAAYPSADQAQIAFLAKGGPERDKLGLDPDGDGFACGWDPASFRQAVHAQSE